MQITKKSIFTGTERTLEINITQDQFDAWKNGMLIQDAMPNISATSNPAANQPQLPVNNATTQPAIRIALFTRLI